MSFNGLTLEEFREPLTACLLAQEFRVGILLLFCLLVLSLYLLPFRRGLRGSYVPSVLTALFFIVLLTLLIVGVLPWGLGTDFTLF